MKIIGFSDVITNSSSEVFVMYDREGVESIKKLVDSILECADSTETFDTLFDIEFELDEDYIQSNKDMTKEELYEQALEDNWTGEGYPTIIGIKVTSKDEKNAKAARLLSNIDKIFESENRYI